MGHRIKAGKLTTARINAGIAQGAQDDARIVLDDISPLLKRYNVEKVLKMAQRTYEAPVDDIVEIGTARPPRRKK